MAKRVLRAGQWLPPFLLVLLLCLIAPLCSHAADNDDADNDAADGGGKEHREVETVQVTATRSRAGAQDVSAAITTADPGQIRAASPDVLPEILRGLPGTYFQQTTPGQGIPIIRGLKGSQVLHLVDGMRVNNAFFRDAPNQYLGLVDAFAMGRVEVVRGASGSLYGADAMGGVVNFLTPDITMPGGDWHAESHLYSSWNSADSGLVMRAETRAGKDGTAFSGGITWQNHHDRRTGGGQTVRPSGYRSRAANLKWMLETGPDADLVLSVQWLEQPSTPRTDELVPGYGQAQPASEQFAFQPNHRGFVHARYRAASSLDWLDQYQVSFARQVITDDRLTQDFGETVVRHEQNDSAMNGLTLQFDHERASGTAFSWGFDHYQDTISSHRTETELTGGTVEDVRSRFPDQSKMDSTAAWLSAEWAPAVRWTIGAGLRYSRTELRLPETTTSPAADLSPDGVSGDLRLIYALSPSVNLVGNAGRGFRPPNIFDLGTLGNRPGNRFNVANTSLGAESVNSYDLGFKVRQGRWQSELFVFYLDYHDKISSVATGEMTATGRTVVRSANLGEATLYGLEAGFAWTGDGHELYGALNYTRGEEAIEGVTEPADRIPPLNGRLGVRYWISDQLQLDAQLQFAGRQDRLSARDVDDPRINPSGTPGWTTINLTARWRPNDDLELGLRLENLADRSYREHGSGIDAPGLNIGAWISLNF